MNLQQLSSKLVDGVPLEDVIGDIQGAAEEMMAGEASPVQMAALLTALRTRGESPAVIAAFARVLRSRARAFNSPEGVLLDTCGTGGDHSGTFNISTTAAFVVAGAGVIVAKHGNRSMTSKCGSADVLQELGVNVECESECMEAALREAGICFLFAQHYHSSMKNVAVVRKELGFRTVFNLIGPLSNPAGASHQLLGVGARPLAKLLAEVLALLGTQGAMVVHGEDGLDEITTTGPTLVYQVSKGTVEERRFTPEDFGVSTARPEDLKGGEANENAQILLDVLDNKPGPKADIVLVNAAAALVLAEKAKSIADGMKVAREAISSGAAREKLRTLVAITSSDAKV